MSLTHTNRSGETLYAVAGEAFSLATRTWKTLPIEYVHASEPHIARFRYLAGYERKKCRVRILAMAPAVGFFGNEHGEELAG